MNRIARMNAVDAVEHRGAEMRIRTRARQFTPSLRAIPARISAPESN
jgi:hypothetical protein